MRVVMSSSSDWYLIFHITYDSCLVIIEVWLSGSEPAIIRTSALVQQLAVRKDPMSFLCFSSIMRVVMCSDWSENYLIFHFTYDPCLVIIEVWLSGSELAIIRRSALVQQLAVRNDPRS